VLRQYISSMHIYIMLISYVYHILVIAECILCIKSLPTYFWNYIPYCMFLRCVHLLVPVPRRKHSIFCILQFHALIYESGLHFISRRLITDIINFEELNRFILACICSINESYYSAVESEKNF